MEVEVDTADWGKWDKEAWAHFLVCFFLALGIFMAFFGLIGNWSVIPAFFITMAIGYLKEKKVDALVGAWDLMCDLFGTCIGIIFSVLLDKILKINYGVHWLAVPVLAWFWGSIIGVFPRIKRRR